MLVSSDYPYLQVRVTVRKQSLTFRALLDTGFDGYLIVPESLESHLGAPEFQVKTRLADGSENMRSQYFLKPGRRWTGSRREIAMVLLDSNSSPRNRASS